MVNPMLGALNQSRVAASLGNLGQIKQMMNAVRSAGNPQAMMQQMMGNSPQYGQVMRLVQQNGGDARRAFYTMAEQMGVDPEQVISALR